MSNEAERLKSLFEHLFQAHPWHGISPGERAPEAVTVYMEIVPTDSVKYELDKNAGHLRLDRPQRFSSLCPMPYGFIPQTYCGDSVAKRCEERTGRTNLKGDGDPLDICVLTEKPLAHGDFLARARPIGGLRMIDGKEADDKIIAVLENDLAYGHLYDVSGVPSGVLNRLRHYFLTYKQLPDEPVRKTEIAETYDREEAYEVIRRSMDDYCADFGDPKDRFQSLLVLLRGTPETK